MKSIFHGIRIFLCFLILNRNKTNILKRVEENFPTEKVDIIEKEFGDKSPSWKLKECLMNFGPDL